MSMPLTVCGSQNAQTSSMLILEKPFLQNKNKNGIGSANANAGFLHLDRKPEHKFRMPRNGRMGEIKAIAYTTDPVLVNKFITVNGTITILKKTGVVTVPSTTIRIDSHLNLELASTKLESSSGKEKPTIKGEAILKSETSVDETYEASLEVPSDFGEIGAVIVEHNYEKEKYVKEVVLESFSAASITINCNSWVQPTTKRVFFTNKSYLLSNTPGGIKQMRKEELVRLRGDGKGKREIGDRIYDYDVYNDLGDNDKSIFRPVLGGLEHPYPRRCRTGRGYYPDSTAEKRPSENEKIYVPRDESFSDSKQVAFDAKTFLGKLHAVIPTIEKFMGTIDFPSFRAIDELYGVGLFKLPFLDKLEKILFFDSPKTLSRDQFFWLSDEEFARQTLAGLNPLTIQLVTEWPLKSTLDVDIYGPQESAISTKIVENEIGGSITIKEAISEKKVFILDYHDALLPYVEKVRDLQDLSLYGSRTLFFLNPDGTLRPLVIELTRPQMHEKPQWKRVFTPSTHGTQLWYWRIAKAHVLSHDSGIHQLISHWLRTHCAVEPYVIATHRQLSAMHPIYRLLHPHFRYTLEINANARNNLISGNGVIETTFALGEYCMELSSDIYDKQWRFDYQALPNDLIQRGMAIEDSTATHGVKLIIEDYPYANDGLIVWDALKQWVTEYVYRYYQDSDDIINDTELQAWWTEIITVGHGDKKGERWWPKLKHPKDLIDIITNIAWVASGHHAAVNFGQYAYAGYIPNRPTIARTNLPTEDQVDRKDFNENPQKFLLKCFPTQVQAATVMLTLDLLSTHDADEEYLGKNPEPSWGADPDINAAFKRFSDKMDALEKIIDHRNEDSKLKNRNGAGVLPYELLKPTSEPGNTGKGIPYSVSI